MTILQTLAGQTLEITLALSVVIAALLLLRPLLKKRYRAKMFYWAWLVVALRLVILWNPSLPGTPLKISAKDVIIVQNQAEPAISQGTLPGGLTDPAAAANGTGSNETAFDGAEIALPNLSANSPNVPETAAKTAPLASNTPSLTLADLFALLWLAGGLVFLGANLFVYARFRRRVRRWKSPVEDPAVLAQFEVLRGAADIKRLTLARCAAISSPLVTGFIHTELLLPSREFSPDALGAIFRHELVHAKRRDLWYKLLLLVVRSIHWFNPLVHLMVRQAGHDLELSCDETVTAGQDVSFRESYGRAVLSAVEGGAHRDAPLTSCFHGGKAVLLERLKAIMGKGSKRRGIALVCALALLVAVVAAACSVTHAAEPGDMSEPAATHSIAGSDSVPIEPEIEPENLLASLPRMYCFTTGTGDWKTELYLDEKGGFSGEYTEAVIGSRDFSWLYWNGSEYYCRFWGDFAQPERIAPFTWSLKIESMTADGTHAKVTGFQYIPSEPYGLENTEELLIYLPGAPIANLPEGFLECARGWEWCLPGGKLSDYEYLPFFGLYNAAEGQGFVAYSEEDARAIVAASSVHTPSATGEVLAYLHEVFASDEGGAFLCCYLANSDSSLPLSLKYEQVYALFAEYEWVYQENWNSVPTQDPAPAAWTFQLLNRNLTICFTGTASQDWLRIEINDPDNGSSHFYRAEGAGALAQALADLWAGPAVRYSMVEVPGNVRPDELPQAYTEAFREFYLASGAITDFELQDVDLLSYEGVDVPDAGLRIFYKVKPADPFDPAWTTWPEDEEGWEYISDTLTFNLGSDNIWHLRW